MTAQEGKRGGGAKHATSLFKYIHEGLQYTKEAFRPPKKTVVKRNSFQF
jgi:hypothetical protein